MLVPPGLVDSGMMIGSIVGNDHHVATGNTTGSAQLSQELETSLPVKPLGFPPKHKAAIAQTYCPEVAHALAGGGVKENGILDFRWYPHAASGTMLLKVHFIAGPKIDARVQH
jgi:hypothetical protein